MSSSNNKHNSMKRDEKSIELLEAFREDDDYSHETLTKDEHSTSNMSLPTISESGKDNNSEVCTGSANGRQQRRRRGNRHRRLTSLSEVFTSIGDGLHDMADDARETSTVVKDGFMQELTNAHDGRTVFLDTTMMRNLSVIPEDLGGLVDEMPMLEAYKDGQLQQIKGKFSFGPYISLFGAVMAISSNGTALSLQVGVPPALKLYWRMTAVSLTLFIPAVKSFWIDGPPKLNLSQWTTFAFAVCCFSGQCVCFVTALQYTSVGNVVLFSNTQAVLLLAGNFLTGSPILFLEGIGALVATGGAILCATDEERQHSQTGEEMNASKAIIGDLLAMLSALLGTGYLTFAKAVHSCTSVLSFMFLMMFSGSFLILGYLVLIKEDISVSIDPDHGIFGWLAWRADRILVEVWIVFVCSLLGTMGFVRSMQYFESLIIAVATLLEPLVASIIASIMRVGVLPGPLGWLGNLLVIGGTFAVVYPSASKGQSAGH